MTKNAAMWQVLRLLRLRHGSGRCLGFLDLDLEAEAGRKDRDRAVEALFILLFIIIAAIILCVFHGVHPSQAALCVLWGLALSCLGPQSIIGAV